MSQSLSSTFIDAALALQPNERAQLVDILLESLERPLDPEVARAIAEEAERRIDEYERGEIASISKVEFLAWRRTNCNH